MIKIFHHDDADGVVSAQIIHYELLEYTVPGEIELIPIDYTDKFPLESIGKQDVVWIVDFSIPPEAMEGLLETTDKVIWIDHHVSSIEKYHDYFKETLDAIGHLPIAGLRSTFKAGCELTWMYVKMRIDGDFSKDFDSSTNQSFKEDCPIYIQLIGDRDTWTFDYEEDSKALHEAFIAQGEPLPDDPWWDELKDEGLLKKQLKKGSELLKHSEAINKTNCDKWAYETEFEGHTILVANTNTFTSEFFGDKINDYPFVGVYCCEGSTWKASLYSAKMDVVDYAKKMGGGGHPRACGFTSEDAPFSKNNPI